MTGTVDVLNCNLGHLTVKFAPDDPIETERAKRIIEDMLRRGYALFIEDDAKKLHKVKKFDASKCEYIIADGPLYAGDPNEPEQKATPTPDEEKPRLSERTKRRIPAGKTRLTGIAPTAGG